jgi:hypothetical protein
MTSATEHKAMNSFASRLCKLMLMFVISNIAIASSDPFAGFYVGSDADGTYEMDLSPAGENRYEGRIKTPEHTVRWSGQRQGNVIRGTIAIGSRTYDMSAKLLNNGSVLLEDGAGDAVVFARSAPSGTDARAPSVIVNGQPLRAEEVRQLLQAGIQVSPGSYWYDPMCGAWGYLGGPTVGFIQAGLPINNPLATNASNGTTLVYVNGRRLPLADLLALQSITGPVLPGRYFMDAQGNAGFEGGPPLINLRQASAARGGGGSWHSSVTGASGADDGQGSGFVTVRDSMGNPTTVGY